MKTARLTLAGILALVPLWAGAGTAAAAPMPADAPASTPAGIQPGPAATISGPAGGALASGTRGLKPAQRRARTRALRRCRRARARTARKRCVRRVKRQYRRIARRQAQGPDRPKPPTAIREVLVTDATDDVLQASYFFPVPPRMSPILGGEYAVKKPELLSLYLNPGATPPYVTPVGMEIESGQAVRFVWDPMNEESAHNVTLTGYPPRVDPRDFEMTGSAGNGGSEGITFQRTFRVPGVYEIRCSLHQLTQILQLTVTE